MLTEEERGISPLFQPFNPKEETHDTSFYLPSPGRVFRDDVTAGVCPLYVDLQRATGGVIIISPHSSQTHQTPLVAFFTPRSISAGL